MHAQQITTSAISRSATTFFGSLRNSRAARHDPRWPLIQSALVALAEQKRRAVRIVDADCACGTFLIEAAREARALGFVAIECRGIDGSPALIGRARAASARLHDHAIGLVFDCVDMVAGLAEEFDLRADIVLYHRIGDRPELAATLQAAGDRVISDGDAIGMEAAA
jgi:hypothetical protein